MRQVHHPRALQFPRDGWTRHFQASSPLAFSPTAARLYKSQSSQSIPLQAPMRGKRCARRYMQTLPCTSPNSAHIYRRNCREHFNGRTSICAVRCGGLAPHLRLVAFFLLTPKVTQITRSPQRPQPRPLETMQMCGATVICMSMRSIISLRHFALLVCMIFSGDPDCWFTSHARAGDLH